MSIDERLQALLAITSEHTEQITKHSEQITKHSEQLETDGRHIRQIATLVHDMYVNIQETRAEMREQQRQTSAEMRELQKSVERVTNGIDALLNIVASHETRIRGNEEQSE